MKAAGQGDHCKTSVEDFIDDGTLLHVKGVFIELGAKGAIELAGSLGVAMDPDNKKYLHTNKKQETNVPGVYAAGDICGPPWQMAKAVGEGCVAGLRRPLCQSLGNKSSARPPSKGR
jgi:thioredoxin reductase (NADPH)